MRVTFLCMSCLGALLSPTVEGFRPSLSRRQGGWVIGAPPHSPHSTGGTPSGGRSPGGLCDRWTPLIEGRGLSSVIPTRFRLETDELLPFTAGGPAFPSDMELRAVRRLSGVPASLAPLVMLGLEGHKGTDGLLPSIMTPPPTPQPMQDYNRPDNFTMNVGKALDVLRVDVPLGFDKEPDLSIYTEDVRFRDEYRVYSNGRFMYQMLFFSLRLARVFMPMPPLVEVLNMRWCEQRQAISVRFQIRVDTLGDQLYFDAVSVYRVNAQGLIYEHMIEKVIRNDLFDRATVVPLFMLQQQGRLATPAPESVL